MNGWRDTSLRRLGATLAGLALYLQLAFASWGMFAAVTPGNPSDGFGEHALCLAGGAPAQPAPSDDVPAAPAHDHQALCCLWHPLAAMAAPATSTPQPVAYAHAKLGGAGDTVFSPGPQRSPVNARAPPPSA